MDACDLMGSTKLFLWLTECVFITIYRNWNWELSFFPFASFPYFLAGVVTFLCKVLQNNLCLSLGTYPTKDIDFVNVLKHITCILPLTCLWSYIMIYTSFIVKSTIYQSNSQASKLKPFARNIYLADEIIVFSIFAHNMWNT